MLSIKSLHKSFSGNTLFGDVSLTIEKGDKIALVGDNGAGKSTFLKIIAGLEEIDGGAINGRDVKIAYLNQEINTRKNKTIADYYFSKVEKEYGEKNKHKLFKLFNVFGISSFTLETDLNKLSGGQLGKIALSVFFMAPTDVLLMDEPTNNLDIKTIIILQELMKKTKTAIVISSHDRELLGRVCNKVFELDKDSKTINLHKCMYENYLKKKEAEEKRKREEFRIYIQKVKQLESQILKLTGIVEDRNNPNVKSKEGDVRRTEKGDQQLSQLQKKLKKIETVEKPDEKEPIEYNIPLIDVKDEKTLGIEVIDAKFSYGGDYVTGPFNFSIPFKSRVCIIGENGVGKSLFLKSLIEGEGLVSGEVNIGTGVKFAKLKQLQQDMLNEELVLDAFVKMAGGTEEDSIKYMKKVGLGDYVFKTKLVHLSPGQRARFFIATIISKGANTIILDEPTNHLDIESVEALETALKDFPGTIITVTHDRRLIKNLHSTDIYEMKKDSVEKITEYNIHLEKIDNKAIGEVSKVSRVLDSCSN